MISSTLRAAVDPTIGESSADRRPATLRKIISIEWLQSGQPDLVSALRRHPVLLRDRSLLLNLAIEEYRAQRQRSKAIDLEQHCHRFREFGSSIQRSILRQLEAQRYLDDHPEFLEALCSPEWPQAGDDFGNFHILEELGLGAIAHVYLCCERDVGNRQVVIKATPFSSFEASILGRLSHPNIIPIHSTGMVSECNLHYLCMPYCGRSTLADLLDVAFQDGCPRRDEPIALAAKRWISDDELPTAKTRRFLPADLRYRSYVDAVLAVAVQLADALDHAHQQHILHGDLKPSNVLLTPSARPLLLDFNLSQDYACSPVVRGGTLPYMPPEHLRLLAGHDVPHEKSAFEPASDVYSFGALLYELLTGKTPVTLPDQVDEPSAVAELLLDRLERGLPPIRQHNPLVNRRLETAILRCLAFDRGNRPTTMAEVRRELKAELRSLPAFGRTARVRPLLFSATVGLPLAVLIAAGTHIATQQPRYVADYREGLRLAANGEPEKAVDHFAAAVGANQSFAPARFELARTRVALGEVDAAMNDFGQLARTENDAHSMAYLGYCFNLKRLPVAAIPWYERAIRNGAASAAIYNNLGASYLDGQSHLPYSEHVRIAEDYLHKALALNTTSITVRLNIVRRAQILAQNDFSFDPFSVWEHARAILTIAPDDALILSHVAAWYCRVCNYEAAHDEQSSSATVVSDAESSAREAFAELCQRIGPLKEDILKSDIALSVDSSDKNAQSSIHGYFLEPHLLGDAAAVARPRF